MTPSDKLNSFDELGKIIAEDAGESSNTGISAASVKYFNDQSNMEGLKEKDYSQDIFFRRLIAYIVLALLIVWLLSILFVIILAGFRGDWCGPFYLSDAVLMTLLGTTTLNVFGLFLVVAKYMFPKRS